MLLDRKLISENVDLLRVEQPSPRPPAGSGDGFSTLLAMHRIAVDPAQLRHGLGHHRDIDATDLIRIAGQHDGVKARQKWKEWKGLARTPLPALANGPEGWFLIGRVAGDEALIQRAGAQVSKVDRLGLEAIWSGELLLVTTRENVGLTSRAFDVSWFIPHIVKYRRLIGEVLLITFALNLLGLAAPLFFQNVVDKVLVHDTVSTLTVLGIGFVGVSIWETVFGWLRTRLYAEISQKIDVELGAKLFRHLLRLPLGYFEARRVGDTAMRVRQLETIREFLTNASLSVLVDPAFTIVFLAAMWIYSTKLFLISVITIPAYQADDEVGFRVALLRWRRMRW
jgi:ATP-binding cassette, subfamily B, bacterial HlyB/CyaB